MSDHRPEDFTPPPRRPAPDALRHRIDRELRAAESRVIGPRHVIAPLAAASLLAVGIFGASQLSGQPDMAPAETPSTSVSSSSASPTTSPTRSTSTRTTASPTTITARAMTAKQIADDTASCTEPDPTQGAEPIPHQGRWRVVFAVAMPQITFPATDAKLHRFLTIFDDVGTQTCLDGSPDVWSSGPPEVREPTPTYPARSSDGSIGMGMSCGTTRRDTGEISDSSVYRVADQVRTTRVTLTSGGEVVRVVDVEPVNGTSLLPVGASGRAAWTSFAYSVQQLDTNRRPVVIDYPRDRGVPASRTRVLSVRDCATIAKEHRERAPEPVQRPTSDAAGDATCRAMITKDPQTEGEFDAADAEVTTRISTKSAWGVVLADGDRFVACSLFPTAEISAVRNGPGALGQDAFGWALNPIVPSGESFWAAGHLPGATKISYGLPNGTTVDATIDDDGYWLVMARTATAFDTEENVHDWEPVRVSVTRNGTTTTYSIAWSEKTMCNQVSHGC